MHSSLTLSFFSIFLHSNVLWARYCNLSSKLSSFWLFCFLGGLIAGVFASLVIVPRQYLLSHNYEYLARRRTIRRSIVGGIFLVGYIGIGLYLLFNHVDMETVCQWCEYLSCLPIFEYCIEFHNNNNNSNATPSPSQK
jgi:hypothetical protein